MFLSDLAQLCCVYVFVCLQADPELSLSSPVGAEEQLVFCLSGIHRGEEDRDGERD